MTVGGDGVAAILGGGDCDEGDAARHAGARDVPGNGVDEDCDGADAIARAAADPEVTRRTLADWRAQPDVAAALAGARDLDLLIVSIDALRADQLPPAAADRAAFPHLSALLDRSCWFQRAFAPAAGTPAAFPGPAFPPTVGAASGAATTGTATTGSVTAGPTGPATAGTTGAAGSPTGATAGATTGAAFAGACAGPSQPASPARAIATAATPPENSRVASFIGQDRDSEERARGCIPAFTHLLKNVSPLHTRSRSNSAKRHPPAERGADDARTEDEGR